MKKTIEMNVYNMKKAFEDYDRDYFSMDGLQALLDYYDSIDENMELDVIGICCDCTEFGGHGASCDFDALESDYGYLLDKDEWLSSTPFDERDSDMYISALIDELEERTTVLHVGNGNYIVFGF